MSLALQQRTAAAAAAALGEEPPLMANWADGLAGMGCCWDGEDDTTAKLHEVRHAACWALYIVRYAVPLHC